MDALIKAIVTKKGWPKTLKASLKDTSINCSKAAVTLLVSQLETTWQHRLQVVAYQSLAANAILRLILTALFATIA